MPTSVALPGPMSGDLVGTSALLGYASGDIGHWDLATGEMVSSISNDSSGNKVNINSIALHGPCASTCCRE